MSAPTRRPWLAILPVLLAPLPSAAASRPEPLKVHLEDVAESAVRGLPVEDVEAALRKELKGRKSIVLVPTPEEATLVLRVTECTAWGEKRRVSEVDERNIGINPRGQEVTNKGGEGMYGVRTEYATRVLLIVRATWGERFEDLQSADDDKNLKSAADTVILTLDKRVKHGLRSR